MWPHLVRQALRHGWHYTFGKRHRRPLTVETVGQQKSIYSSHDGKILCAYDKRSGRSFLVDTGAMESVFPASLTDRQLPPSNSLVAANNSTIHAWGKRNIPLLIGERSFTQEPTSANQSLELTSSLPTIWLSTCEADASSTSLPTPSFPPARRKRQWSVEFTKFGQYQKTKNSPASLTSSPTYSSLDSTHLVKAYTEYSTTSRRWVLQSFIAPGACTPTILRLPRPSSARWSNSE